MSDQDSDTRIGLWVVAAAVAATVVGTLHYAGGSGRASGAVSGEVSGPAGVPMAAVAQPHEAMAQSGAPLGDAAVLDAAPANIEPVGQVFFASGSSQIEADSMVVVRTAVDALHQIHGGRLVLSGFHDAQGSASVNAEVAKRRALAVRDALVAQGIPLGQIALVKPQVSLGGSDPKASRRVDIGLSR